MAGTVRLSLMFVRLLFACTVRPFLVLPRFARNTKREVSRMAFWILPEYFLNCKSSWPCEMLVRSSNAFSFPWRGKCLRLTNVFQEIPFLFQCLSLPRRGEDYMTWIGTVHVCMNPRRWPEGQSGLTPMHCMLLLSPLVWSSVVSWKRVFKS